MTNPEANLNLQSCPSFASSSLFHSEPCLKHQLSVGLNGDDELVDIAFESLSQIELKELNDEERLMPKTTHLQLRKVTSFEDMLMENHRTILIDSIKEYFLKIDHVFLHSTNTVSLFETRKDSKGSQSTIEQSEALIQNILSQNSKISQSLHNRIMERFLQNPDEANIVADILTICPKKISSEVVILLSFLLQDCNGIIQHFKKSNFTKELKHRSIKHAADLVQMPCLAYLFQTQKEKDSLKHFQILVEKWTITLFLMKIGVFENQLDTKSIDDCLKSDIFSRIDLNDLLNQHLVRPSKKMRKASI